jgi:putative phosphoesterase
MRIGLVSDTHIPQAQRELPPELLEALKGVDLILHAGDIYLTSVLDDLQRIAPVLAARGDDDYGSTLTDGRVKNKHVINVDGKTLWLVHERPSYLLSSWWQEKYAPQQPDYVNPDIIIFGHEHRVVMEETKGFLFVSPGSPTFLNYLHGLGTLGILDTNSGKVDVKIVRL